MYEKNDERSSAVSDVCPAEVGKPKQVRQFGDLQFGISSETRKPKQLCCVCIFWEVINSKVSKYLFIFIFVLFCLLFRVRDEDICSHCI